MRLLKSCLGDRRRVAEAQDGPVVVLLMNAFGMGGATRSVFGVSAQLALSRPVEIVSVFRKKVDPSFPFPSGVALSVLDDRKSRRPLVARALSKIPSILMHPDDGAYGWFTLWTDLLLLRRLRAVRSGFVLTSRPAVSVLAALVVRPEVTLVIQEHTHLGALAGDLPRAVEQAYRGSDAVALLTDRDRAQYEALLRGSIAKVVAIPNAVPALSGQPLPAPERRRVVIAAGRLTEQKGFDLLLEAFHRVAPSHPDWRLEIYGRGLLQDELAARLQALGLTAVASLAGTTQELGEFLASSAVFALSSRYEGLPQVVLEAMSKATAIVAFDCPTGPRELIQDGDNGLLVPAEDVEAFAAALTRVLDDVDLRAELGRHALDTVGLYAPEVIGARWRSLFDELVA